MSLEMGIWKSELDIITRFSSKDSYILDIGCGTGRISIDLHNHGFCHVYGIDISEKMIRKARALTPQSYGIEYVCADIVNGNCFSDTKFDLAIFGWNGLMCIKGMQNRITALKNIHSMLRTNGIFVFTAMQPTFSPGSTYYSLWSKRRESYIKQGKRITDDSFGDLYVKDKSARVFHHFTNDFEIETMIGHNWHVVDSFWRADRYTESPAVLKHTNNCRFYILERIPDR